MPFLEFGVCAFFAFVVVGGAVAFALRSLLGRGHEIETLTRELRRLERQLSDLRETVRSLDPQRPSATAEPPPRRTPPLLEAAPIELSADALAPEELVPASPPARRSPASPSIEAWLGAKGFAVAAVVLLVLSAAFFFRELIERDLIGPLARVTIGLVAGVAACVAGRVQHGRGARATSVMLTSAGVALVYLSTYATFGFYTLVTSDQAAPFLVTIVAVAYGFSWVYESPTLAYAATIAGLLNPILLRAEVDRYTGLFVYLIVLNAGAAVMSLVRRWPGLTLLAMIGTQALFLAWHEANFHPAKRSAAVAFQLGLLGVWAGYAAAGPLTRFRGAVPEDGVRLLVGAGALAGWGHVLLEEPIPRWLGALSAIASCAYVAWTRFALARRPDSHEYAFVGWTVAMAFVAATFALELDVPWTVVAWALQGLLLWGFGLVRPRTYVAWLGLAFLALATARYLGWMALDAHHAPTFVPIVNQFAISGLLLVAALCIAALVARRVATAHESATYVAGRVTGVVALVLLWLILSEETLDYFAMLGRSGDTQHYRRVAQVVLSIVWGLYASALLRLGFRLPSQPLRYLALGLFVLTLGKVMTVDLEFLPGFYRVAAFAGFALLLGAAAWGYQKVRASFFQEDGR